jgi:hypothetical protein
MPKPKKRLMAGRKGPKPETLQVAGSWKVAMKKALGRGKPPERAPSGKDKEVKKE